MPWSSISRRAIFAPALPRSGCTLPNGMMASGTAAPASPISCLVGAGSATSVVGVELLGAGVELEPADAVVLDQPPGDLRPGLAAQRVHAAERDDGVGDRRARLAYLLFGRGGLGDLGRWGRTPGCWGGT